MGASPLSHPLGGAGPMGPAPVTQPFGAGLREGAAQPQQLGGYQSLGLGGGIHSHSARQSQGQLQSAQGKPQMAQSGFTHPAPPVSRPFYATSRRSLSAPIVRVPKLVMKPLSGKIIEKPPSAEDLKAKPVQSGCSHPNPKPCGPTVPMIVPLPCGPPPPAKDCSQSKAAPVPEEVTNPIIPLKTQKQSLSSSLSQALNDEDEAVDFDFIV